MVINIYRKVKCQRGTERNGKPAKVIGKGLTGFKLQFV